MALSAEVTHVSGATVGYWRVGGIFLDDINKVGRIVLAGYVDAAAREAGRPPLDRRDVPIPQDRYEAIANAEPDPNAETLRDENATAAYSYIKELAAELDAEHPLAVFSDAEDVL